MTIEERQQEIVDEFSEIEDWFDRYAAIIDEGQNIVLIDEKRKPPSILSRVARARCGSTLS